MKHIVQGLDIPLPSRTRTTVSIPDDALKVFQQIAFVQGKSFSVFVGDWLADTASLAAQIQKQSDSLKQEILSDALDSATESPIDLSGPPLCVRTKGSK